MYGKVPFYSEGWQHTCRFSLALKKELRFCCSKATSFVSMIKAIQFVDVWFFFLHLCCVTGSLTAQVKWVVYGKLNLVAWVSKIYLESGVCCMYLQCLWLLTKTMITRRVKMYMIYYDLFTMLFLSSDLCWGRKVLFL